MNTRAELAAAYLARRSDADTEHLPYEESASLARELLVSGEWRLAEELARITLSDCASGEHRLDLELLMVEALVGMGLYQEALERVEHALADSQTAVAGHLPRSIAWGRILLARVLIGLNLPSEAERVVLPLRTALLEQADSIALGWAAMILGHVAWNTGDNHSAATFYTEAGVSARRIGDSSLEAMANRNLGIVRRQQCRWREATELFDSSLGLWMKLGNRALASHVLRANAIVEWKRGNLSAAMKLAEESHRDAATTGTRESHAEALELIALILLHGGDFIQSEAYLAQAKQAIGVTDTSRPSLLLDEFVGDLHLERGDHQQALALYENVLARAKDLVPDGDIVAEVRRRCAECHLALGRAREALDLATASLKHFRKLGDRYEEAACYRVVAMAAAALGDHETAVHHFQDGLRLYEDIETPFEWGRLWLAYGDWLIGSDVSASRDSGAALEAYRTALVLFDRMGSRARADEAARRIERLTAADPGPAFQSVSRASSRSVTAVTSGIVMPRPATHRTAREQRSEWAFDNFGVITADSAVLRLLEMVERLAKSRTPILILGESGTGKELIAHSLHRHSGRDGQYLAINCAALPREVIQSELFGHVAGSFTGATRDKAGLLEVCARGTVFLDEIGEMPLDLQSHLLRFLETGEIRRVGALKTGIVDTRVVAATNRDATSLRRGDGFRKDLYYRLAHAVLDLPPLRQRGAKDIEMLARHFLAVACREERKQVTLSPAALERLIEHSWPGNIRELKSEVSRRVLLARDGDAIAADDLHLDPAEATAGLDEELERAERDRIQAALRQYPNRSEAARALGIPRTTLINRIRRMKLKG